MPTLLRAGLSRALTPVNLMLDRLERRRVTGAPSIFVAPPVFIIGPPRTGSTLLYQTLLNRFEFGYFSNLHAYLHGAPSLVGLFLRSQARRAPAFEYSSDHGNTRGLLGPSEAGAFWYRWFPRDPQYVGEGDFDADDLETLRGVLAEMTRQAEAPLLVKNMPAALRLRALGPLLPEAIFIVVTRNPLWTAQSILLARESIRGDPTCWWSLEPPTIDELKNLPPVDQAVRQVRDIEAAILMDSLPAGADRFLPVRYEELCDDPAEVLARIRTFVRMRGGYDLTPRGEVPDRLSVSEERRLEEHRFTALVAAVERIYGPEHVHGDEAGYGV